MRKTGALAAACILVIALGASGCDLVSSLTPFGVGTQSEGGGGGGGGSDNVNGLWTGKTESGGDVSFQIGTLTVINMKLNHIVGDCELSFFTTTGTANVAENAFSLNLNLENYGQGRIVIEGRFTSANTCTGTYFFEARPAGSCPTSGRGTFAAVKS